MSTPTFFSPSLTITKPPPARHPECGKCGLLGKCESPKMPVSGKGRRGIMIVGEAPSENDDARNKPFTDGRGERLRSELRRLGVDMVDDCFLTNALICRPPRDKIDKAIKIDYCRPNIIKAIETLKPKVIILLGARACRSVIATMWDETIKSDDDAMWAGYLIPAHKWNCWICPTFDPKYVNSFDGRNPVLDHLFIKHLEAAVLAAADMRPWLANPNYVHDVKTIHDPAEAAKYIEIWQTHHKLLAFDYETDRLKPDDPSARIVCCALANDQCAIAYPWHGPTITATSKLLLDPTVKKIGANIKFEERWTRAKLGHGVRGWKWDTVLGAHVMDARSGTNGVKFQALVRLGMPAYNNRIRPFLEAKEKGGNAVNEIKQIDLQQLLRYCGLDALLEYKIAKQQMSEMGL